MARLATTAAHFCQRLQDMYPQKLGLSNKQGEQSSPLRRWTMGSGTGSSYRSDHRSAYNKKMSENDSTSAGSAGTSNSNQGAVSSWSLGLNHLLADAQGVVAFTRFLSQEFATENIRFWQCCENYIHTSNPQQRTILANEIWTTYINDNAPELVNLDAAAKRAVAIRISEIPAPVDLFELAQTQIYNVMKFDSYPRFLRSEIHAEYARAELCGKTAGQESGGTSSNNSSKLKKSASNASERRRSGGATLLPWKLRTASRDRGNNSAQQGIATEGAGVNSDAQAAIANDAIASTSRDTQIPIMNITDVVRGGPGGPGGPGVPGVPGIPVQCTLCRVVLPDGATSVVGVNRNVTVKQMVEKLLLRRNIYCPSYDITYKECVQLRDPPLIDGAIPSNKIGGRELVIERRCVVRIELGTRCVAVRCRPSRRLRHVLKPVMARYGAGVNITQRAVMTDGSPVHPDTSMQELDGHRLHIVEVTGHSEGVREEDDSDSFSDLALRMQEELRDDEISSSSGYTRTEPVPVPRLYVTLPPESPVAGPNAFDIYGSSEQPVAGPSGFHLAGQGGSHLAAPSVPPLFFSGPTLLDIARSMDYPIAGPSGMHFPKCGGPVAGPSGLYYSGSMMHPIAGPSGLHLSGGYPTAGIDLSRSSGYPVAGPSGYPVAGSSGYPDAGPSGLDLSRSTGLDLSQTGVLDLSRSTGYPVAGSSGLHHAGTSGYPIAGPSGIDLSRSSGHPIAGPSGLHLAGSSGYPVAGPSGLASGSQGPVAGPSGMLSDGRVRAALRQGPPLHHHPPEFLENLRETQRQRLQSRNDSTPPRTPPPLPPKPYMRSAPSL